VPRDNRRPARWGVIVVAEVTGAAHRRQWSAEARIARGMRPRIRWLAASGHPNCRAKATYVRGPGRYELLDGRWRSKNELGCGVSSRGVRSSPAGRITKAGKKILLRDHAWGQLWALNGFGQDLGTLTALLFGLGMAGLDADVPATPGLSTSSLPALDLPLAFRILAVALGPASRLVRVLTTFAQAAPPARLTCPGQTTVFSRTVEGAHGSGYSQGKARGEC
jgi:hypothetical protein